VANPRLADVLRRALPPWNVNALAETLIRCLPDHLLEYERSRRKVISDRVLFERRLREVPRLAVFPSHANFVYAGLPHGASGTALRNLLLTEFGLLIRECGNKIGSGANYIRLAARPADQLDLLVDSLRSALAMLPTQPHSSAGYTEALPESPLLPVCPLTG
jgi:histidinol-phosphate/aromatic aminotransferase/cobyric acid decarboxylase-like protein